MTATARIHYDALPDLLIVTVPELGYRFPIGGELAQALHDALSRFLAGERPLLTPTPPDPIDELHGSVRALLHLAYARLDRLDATLVKRVRLTSAMEAAGIRSPTLHEWEAIIAAPGWTDE